MSQSLGSCPTAGGSDQLTHGLPGRSCHCNRGCGFDGSGLGDAPGAAAPSELLSKVRSGAPGMQSQLWPAADKPSHMLLPALCQQRTHALQQTATYSICSSAINNRLKGTSMSSARAVVRLMLRVNLVGNWIDRSPTGVPRRMRST